jgi:hypothetical protein
VKLIVEVTDILADCEIVSEVRDYRLHGDVALGGLTVRVLGEAVVCSTSDGYGGRITFYELEEL